MAGIQEQSTWARNRVGIGLSYRPARLHGLAESIPGLLRSLKIPSLFTKLPFQSRKSANFVFENAQESKICLHYLIQNFVKKYSKICRIPLPNSFHEVFFAKIHGSSSSHGSLSLK